MKKLEHKFVEVIPRPLEDGILYISLRFGIVSHNCCCGCGNEVVTNLSPRGWQLTYDGESVSLYPSIGNWTLKCRSHYWIKKGNVRWASDWSEERVQDALEADGFEVSARTSSKNISKDSTEGIWRKIRRHLGGSR